MFVSSRKFWMSVIFESSRNFWIWVMFVSSRKFWMSVIFVSSRNFWIRVMFVSSRKFWMSVIFVSSWKLFGELDYNGVVLTGRNHLLRTRLPHLEHRQPLLRQAPGITFITVMCGGLVVSVPSTRSGLPGFESRP